MVNNQVKAPNAGQVMLDPQAPLATKVQLPGGVHMAARTGKSAARPGDAPALLGSLAGLLDDFDFGSEHRFPSLPLQSTVVLEVDVPTFSRGQQSVPPEHQGGELAFIWCSCNRTPGCLNMTT